MKRILMSLSLCFMLFGCASTPSYERNTGMATLNNTEWETIMDRIEKDETFMFMVTYDECSSCEYFIENVLSDYIRNHGFELNRVNFSNDSWERLKSDVEKFILANPYTNEIKNLVDDYEDGMLLTPTLYFVENGEVKDMLVGSEIKESELDAMIVKYKLDEVK